MDKSTRLNLNLPNSANDEIADINDISDNFRTLDDAELVTNKTGSIDAESTDVQYPTAKSVFEKFENSENKTDKRFNELNEKFANALVEEKSGSMIRVDDINPTLDNIIVNVQPVSDTGLIEQDITQDTVIALPDTTSFTMIAQAASSTASTSKFIPYVNGTALSAAAINTSADIIPRDFNLTFKISGTKLNITGTKTYVYEETVTENINVSVDVSSGAKITGLAISGMASGEQDHVKIDARDKPSKIYQFGRNILNPTPWTAPSTVNGVTYTYLPDEDCFLINGTSTAGGGPRKVSPFYALGSGFITSLKYISGSVTIPAEQNKFASFHLGKADTTTGTASNFFSCGLQNSDNTTAVKFCDKNYWQASWFYVSAGVVFENYKIRLQIERNNSATAYEQYTAPAELTPDADGNVTAARGKVCTFAVKSPGTLSTRYNRDINKAFDELKQAIISLGGNV